MFEKQLPGQVTDEISDLIVEVKGSQQIGFARVASSCCCIACCCCTGCCCWKEK
jgi:hypothetical protein